MSLKLHCGVLIDIFQTRGLSDRKYRIKIILRTLRDEEKLISITMRKY